MIFELQRLSFPYVDHIGNFIENKIRQTTCFQIDPILYDKISVHTNISQLQTIETVCDYYLEHEELDDVTINKMLELRDIAIMRYQKLQREEKVLAYLRCRGQYNDMLQGYSHSMQVLLPEELRLTHEQKQSGYLPHNGEPVEYNCGCLTMCYHVPCDCYKPQACEIHLCDNACCNEKKYPEIKSRYMCETHKEAKMKKMALECAATVKKELGSIKYSKSLDYKDMHVNKNKKRASRFPWKNRL
jgi:hypothetical protein